MRLAARSSTVRREVAVVLVVAAAAFLAACKVVSVAGPSSGRVDEVLTFEVFLEHTEASSFLNREVWLTVEVPESWSFVGASYTGMVGGEEVAGVAHEETIIPSAEGCELGIGPAPTGARRIRLTTTPFPQGDPGDQGIVTLDLRVGGPPGDHTLRFELMTIAVNGLLGGCSGFFSPVDHEIRISPLSVTEVPVLETWGLAGLAAILAALGCSRLVRRH